LDEEPEALKRAFAAREAWAYEAAYRTYERTLGAAAYGVLRSEQDARDCVHDAILRLWRQGSGYRPERGSLRAFLAVCVRNEALSRSRKTSNRERIARSIAEPLDRADPSDAVVQRESMRAALQSLSEKQRESIELAYYRGLTHEEIARTLDEPVGTIKSRLSASLRRLRDAFAQERL
jgi:RNA polymerase sigma-70 factor (ECF subfamily)